MKKYILLTIIFVSIFKTNTFCQYLNENNMLYTFGVKNDQLFGAKNSKFGNGIGFSFESYVHFKKFSMAIFSFDYYQNINTVGDSQKKCTFWTFYYFPLDYRFKIYMSPTGRAFVYWGLSTAPQMMKVEGTKGVDWSWIVAGSVGFQYAMSNRSILQLQCKPYITFGNQLVRIGAPGLEAKLSLGFMLVKH